ncbi:P-loop containing nucleoside triphosphate hydrolase protein [Dacryopinax primogenitus]|uniref:p-loop containing nucleoside triphosphate hydrolase protein n=1 Tax=Dacryopinax primogenitus (strain DJM 731) TaxID=1858805 RepID=M5GCP7_DACPD|nr:P-loop containing nucleoside triphosphate hydrolase protein [Dacryopinax primogenitus]EJU03992.1 P-loop containing nucleoside triphosphate hydrolase protein [Dacryopinax primogenitus]
MALGKRSRTLPTLSNNKLPSLTVPHPKRARTSLSPLTDCDPYSNKENIPPSPCPSSPIPSVVSLHDELDMDTRVTRSRARSSTPRIERLPSTRRMPRRADPAPEKTSTRRTTRLTIPVLAPTPPLTPESEGDSFDAPLLTPSLDMGRLILGDEDIKCPSPTSNAYVTARGALKAPPSDLAGREDQRIELLAFLSPFLSGLNEDDDSRVMYISGTPGTGKTALVKKMLSEIKADGVRTGMINCMGLASAKEVWDTAWGTMEAEKVKDSKMSLEKLLEEGDKFVLVLDEIDTLLRLPSVLSTILNLPSQHPNLCLLTIANSLSLPSQLPASISLTQVSFAPYTWEQMTAIVKCKLPSECTVIDEKALELAARRVGGRTGDLRVLVEVLRKALDAAEKDWKKRTAENPFIACDLVKVSPAHILAAIKTVTFPSSSTASSAPSASSPTTVLIRTLPVQTRLILLALLVASYRTSLGLPLTSVPSFGTAAKSKSTAPTPTQLFASYSALLSKYGGTLPPALGSSDFHDVLNMLEASSLVSYASSTGPKKRTTALRCVTLVPQEEEVRRAMFLGLDQSAEGVEEALKSAWTKVCKDARNEVVRRGKKAEREANECPLEERL